MTEISLEDLQLDETIELYKDTLTVESIEPKSGRVVKYMVIPDTHIWDKNIRGRKDYVGEVKSYMNRIIELAMIEKETSDELILIFAGDIFHQGFKDVEEFGYWFNWFIKIREIFDEVYSVLGNHEINYYKNNPFWSMVEELETTELKRMNNKTYIPKGELPLIRVVDKIEDGDWTIHLAHFTSKPLAEGTNNIGIFHSSIIDNTIANTLKDKYGRDPLTEYIDHSYVKDNNPFINMEYAFVAHMHKAYGLFTVEAGTTGKTRLRYMASLGRTNEMEVTNNDLDRVIPVIQITDGKECEVKELPFKLLSREDSIVLSEVEENKMKAQEDREVRYLNTLTDTTTDPINEIKHLFRDDELLYSIFDASINDYRPDILVRAGDHIIKGIDYNELEAKVRELSKQEV